jgi:GTP-dependent phosphoenolpyruvate carboxykinase
MIIEWILKEKLSKIFTNNHLERRLQGRPNNRWWNCVQTDINKRKIKNWKEKSRPEDSTHILHPHARYMPGLYEPLVFE